MIELIELIKAGGPWAILTGWLIFRQDKRYNALQEWIQHEVITIIKENTAVMKAYKEKLDKENNK